MNKDIQCKPLQEHVHLSNFEVITIKFYQNNQKWLLLGLSKQLNQKCATLFKIWAYV